MNDFIMPSSSIHLGGSPRGKRMDVWFIPVYEEDFLVITEWEDGQVESAWGFSGSIDFYRRGGLRDASGDPSSEVIAVARRRLPEANAWLNPSTP